jgi:predicted HAD superfamily phosphohydrolase YqeG
MKIIASEQLICVDIDETLILWKKATKGDKVVSFRDPYDGSLHYVVPHNPHIKILRDRKTRGATIIVWSASGWQWAEQVVKALNLQEYVDYIASKPIAYIDDKPVEEWMAERIYLPESSLYGKL